MPAPLVALDLDGTLLTEASVLTPGHERAVGELRRAGCHVAIVTGRPVLITQGIYRRLGLTTPVVCFNGGWVGFPGQPAMASLRLNEIDVRDILEALHGRGGVACGYPDERSWWMDRLAMETAGWPQRYGAAIEIRPEDFAPWKGPSFKVMYVADPSLTPGIVRDLRAHFGSRFHVVLSQPDRLEVLPKGISKVWGLSKLAAMLGVPREDVWSVGDAENDIEMVAWAGHGCAMGHCPERLRAVARHILPGIHARGLCALPLLMQRHYAGCG
ncbi:MAG: HAD family phosphatase [Planctomycetes bacterium]|nr:HAD family phosphatase [Planctomycetota bacterium]